MDNLTVNAKLKSGVDITKPMPTAEGATTTDATTSAQYWFQHFYDKLEDPETLKGWSMHKNTFGHIIHENSTGSKITDKGDNLTLSAAKTSPKEMKAQIAHLLRVADAKGWDVKSIDISVKGQTPEIEKRFMDTYKSQLTEYLESKTSLSETAYKADAAHVTAEPSLKAEVKLAKL